MSPANHRPPDDAARRRALERLDITMLVEAAAGTGKTTLLVERMTNLVSEGRCLPGALAAVTFTRKAAAEMRERFARRLRERMDRATDDGRRARLAAALEQVGEVFIGTIHSFCARLLRERCVEAGVDAAFTPIEQEDDWALRRRAWREWVARLHGRDDPLLDELLELGLEITQLEEPFTTAFADYPDVDAWPEPEIEAMPADAVAEAREALHSYAEHMAGRGSELSRDAGCRLMDLFLSIPRRLRFLADADADLLELLAECPVLERGKVKVTKWPGGKDDATGELDRWNAFVAGHVEPLVTAWRALRYRAVLRCFRAARKHYDALRAEANVLNFQDLLMRTAEMLASGGPALRDYFRRRYSHLLVDEFQDTDPIQAKVMLLLTADDAEQDDWREGRPVPGSLFVVGDPKQSIYRFRRADIVTYNEVRRIIASCGELEVLSANFRSTPPLIDWVNRRMADRFPPEATPEAPAYVALEPGRAAYPEAPKPAAAALPALSGRAEEVAAADAERIAQLIQGALAEGRTPSDFLVLTWQTKRLGLYAAALQARGIPHEVTGGTRLNELPEIRVLHDVLVALAEPDNPLPLVSLLRGEACGVSDQVLYDFRRAGGSFHYRSQTPEGAAFAPIAETYARLVRYAGLLGRLPRPAAIESIVDDLGLYASAALRPGANMALGALAKTVELLRDPARGASLAEAVERLGQIVSPEGREQRHDAVPARPLGPDAVRVMNLHKAKGLQAPAVFLADPHCWRGAPVTLHVDRSSGRSVGRMAVYAPTPGRGPDELLACPPDWSAVADCERAFLDAEQDRLLYVALTRAGRELYVSDRDGRGAKSNPWVEVIPEHEIAPPESPPASESAESPDPLSPRTVEAAMDSAEARRGHALRPTYATARAKEVSVTPAPGGAPAGEHAAEWGAAVHLLLEAALTDEDADLRALARTVLREQDLPPERAHEAVELVRRVRRCDLWRRARAAERTLVEVPLQHLLPAEGDRPETLVRGVVDLVFREPSGWVVADYKTGGVTPDELDALSAHYAGQIRTYAEAWEALTGEPVVEAGLYFVTADAYRRL